MNLLPRREATQLSSGDWLVTVTPPRTASARSSSCSPTSTAATE